jgi:cytoskeletal protein RodZ
MKVQSFNLLRSVVAGALVLLLLAPIAQAAPRQTVPDQQPQTEPQTAPTTSGDLPQAPAAQNQTNAQKPADQQTTPEPRPGNPSEPVGTAVAPLESPVGAAVSRPTGAAIAPAKQKRRHTFIIRLGLVVGAAVAIGTVVALSKASPNRPNQ